MHDPLGDMIKAEYERPATSITASPDTPLILRLDGRAFHTFTHGCDKPVDKRISTAIIYACGSLVGSFHAEIGYCQSDEITLVLSPPDSPEGEYPFGGKIQKLCSVAAGFCTGAFMLSVPPILHERLPHFDCRVFSVPDMATANKVLLWREQDAIRNGIQALGQHVIGKKRLHGMSTKEVAKRLKEEHELEPMDYGSHFARGTYMKRIVKDIRLTDEQYYDIPEKHRPPRDQLVKRSFIEAVNYDPRLYEEEYE